MAFLSSLMKTGNKLLKIIDKLMEKWDEFINILRIKLFAISNLANQWKRS